MTNEDVKKLLIVGAGTMGHGIAQVFAQGGYQVSLFSRTQKTLDRASSLIQASLNTLVEGELLEESQIPAIISRIEFTSSLEESAKDADIAIETVSEDAELKKKIFIELDKYCPQRTILASNTTALNIFDLVETSRPEKVLICHWYTPPQLIPLVDVVKGPDTDNSDIEVVIQMLKKLGKKPMLMNKFVPGYLIPRLQMALQREAFYLLDNEYLTPQALDEAAKTGLALRMIVLGLVQRIDFGGLDITVKGLQNPRVQSQLTPLDYKPKKILKLVEQEHLGIKTGRGFYDYEGRSETEVCHVRDIRLMKILKAYNNLGDGPL